ncbi:MAG: small multi-drug export protein [Oscillospiraceae bacterium]
MIELRGAIPIGVIGQQLPLLPVLAVSVLGNMLPVPIILLFAKKVLLWCCKLPDAWGRFFQKIHDKGMRAGEKIQKKAGKGLFWGIFLFVAIPLPGTGAWTGALGAALLDLKFWPSVLSIMCGVVTAGLIMLLLSSLGVIALY